MPTVSTTTDAHLAEVGIPPRIGAAILAALCQVDPKLPIELNAYSTYGDFTVKLPSEHNVCVIAEAGETSIIAFAPDDTALWVIVPVEDAAIRAPEAGAETEEPSEGLADEPIPLDSLTQVLTDRLRELHARPPEGDE